MLLWARRGRDREERGEHARGPAPRAERIFGEPAVAFRAPLSRLAPVLAIWALLGAPVLVLAVIAFVGGKVFLGAVLTVAGLWCLVPLMPIEAARVSAGGVWLTPSGVLVREPGLDSRIAWADLRDVLITDSGHVHLRADHTAGTIHRPAGKPWLRAGSALGPQHAVVEAQWLAVDARTLARVIAHYRDSKDRLTLGSAEEQQRIEALIQG
ncbi:hypothetical protein GXB85_12980 [Cellulomonas sp. APG4]|uniref:hypothetical protein n=1 Tax=Cellulomonas sp. APG4 TaxID=1538656 RepID=UPI00137A9502|nr:hypothetical protein [Cellulomonas sp. APG4]NCT91858.1 hypothetical protein [Cellulomonas sp. APG4]